MRILIVTEIFPPGLGGVPIFVERLATQLANAGHETVVITGSATFRFRTEETVLSSGVRVVHVPAVASIFNRGNNRMSYNPWRGVSRIFKDFRPHCVHMHTPAGLLHAVALRKARRYNVPVVITNHVMPENLTMNLPPILTNYATKCVRSMTIGFINKTDYLVAPTKTALSLIDDSIRIQTQVITNGIDSEFFCPGNVDPTVLKKYKINPYDRIILYTGRLDGEKRVDIAIDAFAQLVKRQDGIQLVIVGDGIFRKDLIARADRLGMNDRVTFTGRISEFDKLHLLRFSTVFVMPSPAELQCISVLEALSCGKPIVVANKAALRELVREDKNGYLFSYPHASECAIALNRVLEWPSERIIDEYTRQWIVRNHEQSITLKKYTAVYRQLHSKASNRPYLKRVTSD